ncbi:MULTISPECIES: class I adenylate-forming enzyme family protein [Pontibacillus]|uniref:Long-chain fatty acid--CoA ligase n=1 Tax=Pontibacillus chungwhensis TaxID=265426 RepID=A0ABY8UYC3_9BACI|nr:long-chain fatty acid--CoA ligase [Pontibacillus chungwhensis]MCD5325829.1 long-chain fatty acid--CoA ligase [Pontibacillus sp. HN14]WIF98360.1 long-chain fatty acid--CoA ligase [Pontibacillus chungwhensis]
MRCELDWIKSRARLFPKDRAVVDSATRMEWTFEDINNRAEKLAAYLLEMGVKRGDRVALFAPNDISYFDFLFACMKSGAIFVPVNWRLSEEEVEYILEDATPTVVGVHDSQATLVEKKKDYVIVPITNAAYVDGLETSVKTVDQMGTESEPLAMIYTGGTTGKPKGAILTYDSIRWNALNTIVSWNLCKEDTTLTCLPMFHTGGLNALSLPVLMAGGTVVVSKVFEAEQAVNDLIQYNCTIALFVPTMYHMMIRTEAFRRATFDSMNVFLSGGAPCPLTIYRAFHQKGLQFKEGYGLTEAGPNNFFIHPDEAVKKPGSVGRAMVFNDVKIVKDDGGECPAGEVGELLLRGQHVFSFYWNNPEATQESLQNGWLHTGDLARQDKDGFFYIVGRKKEMIITGGENVFPLEIEHWLSSLEGVNEVAIVGLSDNKWGEVVTAFVSLHSTSSLTEEDLREHCALKLSRYKIPKAFHIIDELPKTHVGKIDKKALQANDVNQSSSHHS